MMRKKIVLLLTICFLFQHTYAQIGDFAQGEVGLNLGAATYFGDLNTNCDLKHPKPAIGLYYLKEFNGYLGFKTMLNFIQVGYSDSYSTNVFQKRRNLSFDSNIWELAVMGEFNFLKYNPIDPDHSFTPFINFGIGVFTYNPYTYLNGQKYFLRSLGTEGQNVSYNGRKPYGTTALCFPIGEGIKFNLNRNLNVTLAVILRLTTTDYLDDVSTTYAGINNFPSLPNGKPSPAQLLQDRSWETGATTIGVAGRQRGWSSQKDQYVTTQISFSYNIFNYNCPSATAGY